jgi:hypothetical protein
MAEKITAAKIEVDSPAPWQNAAARFAAACAIYALVIGTVFGDMLYRTDAVLSAAGTDTWRQFYPWRMFGFGELAHFHVALWNPYIFSGAPFLVGFQAALLYPLNWIFLFLPLPMAINVGIALHLFLAGVFMYLWAAYRRLHWAACLSAGLIYMFGGPEFGRVVAGHITHIDTLAWAPLVFLAIDDLTMTRSLRGALLGSAAFAMQIFAGHAQYAFYTAVAATIYFALNLRAAPNRWRAIAGYFLTFSGGGLLAAAQLFTGLGATFEAVRSHTTYTFASTFSFPPENLLTLIFPGIFGGSMPAPRGLFTTLMRQFVGDSGPPPLPYWGRWFWWEASAYVGVVGLVLAAIALATPRRGRRFAFTMAVIICILGMGKYTPVFHIVYRLPGFSSFRGMAKFMFLFVMFIAMLAAIGLDRLLARGAKTIRPAVVVGIASIVVLGAALLFNSEALAGWNSIWGRIIHSVDFADNRSMMQEADLDFLYRSAKVVAGELCWAGIIGLALAGLLVGGHLNRRVLFGIPVLMAIELMVFANYFQPTFSLARYRHEYETVRKCLAPLAPDVRVAASDQGQLFMAGRLNCWGDDPMMLRRYVDFETDAMGADPTDVTGGPMEVSRTNRLMRLVRMKGVLIIDRDGAHLSTLDADALPRAELVGTVEVEPERLGLLAAMNDPKFDPLHTAIIESPIAPAPTGAADPGSVTVRDIDSDTLDIEATANSPCLLVVTDSYSTGWHAEAMPYSDRRQYQVVPTDLTLRGVPLAKGHHHFRLVYRPLAFVVGKWTNIAAIIGYLAVLGFWWMGIRTASKARRLNVYSPP